MNDPDLKILGIDPGTIKTGYGMISYAMSSGKMNSLGYGRILVKEKFALADRYKILFTEMKEIIASFRPDTVSIETQFVKLNPQTALKLGMARGIIILAASLEGIPVFEYSPREAKKAVVGNGSALKNQVQFMVSRILSLPESLGCDQEDEADALALAICHIHATSLSNLSKRLAKHV
ncbi:MAG: crossover junction endodeoxyribonuclease RuvC [Victivallaceae bacterium]